jgi:GDP-D-mannose 3', 5'-epimerase
LTLDDEQDLILGTRAHGFIRGAMVADLRCQGYKRIRAVDIKPLDEWYQVFEDADNLIPDLNLKENCERAAEGPASSTISLPIRWRRTFPELSKAY